MSIGPDIKEVFEELGMPVTLYKVDGSTVTGEFIDYDDTFHKATTELQRQFALTVSFAYDSQAVAGDIVQLVGFDTYYIVISLKPSYFEATVVILEGYLLKCNVLGRFARQTETRNGYDLSVTWPTVQDLVYGVQFERGSNSDAESVLDIMEIPVGTKVLYVPNYSTIRVGDRWYPDNEDDSEYYRVNTIHTRRFSGCKLVYLTEDTRE